MGEGKALIPGGYIIIARSIVESEVWKKPPLYLKVWLYLLHTAQFKPYKNLKKGQLFVTIKDIQEGCSWFVGCRKSTATKDQIFQILDWMRKPSVSHMKATTKATMITTTKATHGMLITIDNYCVYQNPKLYESNDEGNTENDTKAIGEQRTTNNINKEGSKNGKNETLFVEEIPEPIPKPPKTRTIVNEYYDLFVAKYNAPPVITQKQCAILNRIVKQLTMEETVNRLKMFFADTDKFVVDSKHDVGVFNSRVDRYIPVVLPPPKPLVMYSGPKPVNPID